MTTDARQLRRQQSHERILDAAAGELFRSGVAGVGVADVMRQAGLTHGGFYAHFASRDALLVAALDRAGEASLARLRAYMQAHRDVPPLRALIDAYLSLDHMCAGDTGCAVAALGSELARTADLLHAASAQRVRGLVALVREALPPDAPASDAPAIAATMAGALQMARVLGSDSGGPALLQACRASLLAQYGAGAAG